MPTNNENLPLPDLGAILEGLAEEGIEFILVGGLAAVVQGAPFTTVDVDIVPKQSPENIAKLLSFLKSIDAFHRRMDDKVIGPTKRDISGRGHALFTTRFGPLDVLAVIEEKKAYEDLIEHSVEISFRGYTIHVLNLKTLIQLKKTSTDLRDRQRLSLLEETLRQSEGK
jgi:predicted nucleotidyltransferase